MPASGEASVLLKPVIAWPSLVRRRSSPVRSFDVDECVEADAPIKVAWQLSFDPEVRSTIATTFCYADSTIATTFVPLGPRDQCLRRRQTRM